MKKMKRLLTGLMAIIIFATMMMPVYAAPIYEKEGVALSQEEIVDLLMGLNIIEGYEDGEFHGERNVTRAEMATIIVKTLKLDEAPITEIFDDVTVAHWANGFIARAYAEGIIKGDGNGSFRPDATVTYAEIYTMLVNVLNYQPKKDLAWPANFVTVARSCGIADGIAAYDTAAATRDDVALIIWNALNTKIRIPYTDGDISTTILSDKTLFETRYDSEIDILDDYIFAGYELVSEADEEFEIEIALKKKEKSDASYYTYVANDFYMIPTNTKVDVIAIDDTVVSIKLAEDYKIVNGFVAELIDSNKKTELEEGYGFIAYNKKNIVGEHSFVKNLVVDEVKAPSRIKNVITFINNKNNITVIHDEDNNEYNLYEKMFIYGEERLTAVDLKAGDVLTKVAENIYLVSREKVEGIVEDFDADDTFEYITIDNENYIIFDVYCVKYNKDTEKYDKIKLAKLEDEKVTAYINAFGEVVVAAIPAEEDTVDSCGIITGIKSKVKRVSIDDADYIAYSSLNGAVEGDIVIYHIKDDKLIVDKIYTTEMAEQAMVSVTEEGKSNIHLNIIVSEISDDEIITSTEMKNYLEEKDYEVYFIEIADDAAEFYSVEKIEVDEIKPSFFKEDDRIEIEDEYMVIVRGF